MDQPDEDSFRVFVERQWSPFTRTALLMTGDRGHAEDLVQSALEKAHRKWARVGRMDAPEAYVRRVIVTTAISWRRRRRFAEVALAHHDRSNPHDPYVHIEHREQVIAGLRKLPPKMRAVLVLRYLEDLSEAETADTLGCSVGTVKSQTSRGLARLREHLSPTARPTALQEIHP